MTKICPNPMQWNEVYQRLSRFAETHDCVPSLPPKPLILAGWAFSNDVEKLERWKETILWAEHNGCSQLAGSIPESDFYFADEPTTYTVGPLGGPMYRAWDFDSKKRPSSEILKIAMDNLLRQWSQIAGNELLNHTQPVKFTGKKARRLLIKADEASHPPWGGWAHLSSVESERRTFTKFRKLVNKAISPHEVDHIDFILGKVAEQKILME